MTREQLRAKLMSGCDDIMAIRPWFLVSSEKRQLAAAARSFWATLSDAELDRFLALLGNTAEPKEE